MRIILSIASIIGLGFFAKKMFDKYKEGQSNLICNE